MIIDQTSKASKESYSATSEQGKDGLCSTVGMQCKRSQVQSHDCSEAVLVLLLFYTEYWCCLHKEGELLKTSTNSYKENKGIKRNLRRNRVHFHHNKEQRKQIQKGSRNTLPLHYQSSLPPHFSSFQNHSSSSCLTPFGHSLLNQFAVHEWRPPCDVCCMEYVEIVQHGRNHTTIAE